MALSDNLVQQASGTFSGASPFTVSLPAASAASSRVVLFVIGNTTVTTPSGFTLRASQVNWMGHYLFDRAGGAASYTVTPLSSSANAGMWYLCEVANGVFDTAVGANNTADATTYASPAFTPAAGEKLLLMSFGSLDGNDTTATADSWTGGYVEQADFTLNVADRPMGAVAAQVVTANGSTSYPSTVTFSKTRIGRSVIAASYTTAAASPVIKARMGGAQVSAFRLGTATPGAVYLGTTKLT